MSTKVAVPMNGQTSTALHQVGRPRDPEFVKTYEAAQAQPSSRETILEAAWGACVSLGIDPKTRLSINFNQAYLCNFPAFNRERIRVDDKQDDLRSWARVHLANAKLKLIGKNGELDTLLAAMLTCRLIGLTGYSGTGKTASIKLMLSSITDNPNSVNIVDCGTVYSKDQLLGHVDEDGEFVKGLINGDHQFIVLDEFSRMHGSLQSALVKVTDEGCIRVDGKIHRLHPNFKIFVVYNGLEDGGTNGIIQAILDRLQVVIQYKHVSRESTKINGRLTNGNKDWQDDVGYPDDKFRGIKLFELFSRVLEKNNGKADRTRLVDLMSEAVAESRDSNFWAPGTQLSERATEILGRIGNALMAVHGTKPSHLSRDGVLFGIAREVLKNTAYNQLAKNPHREETKDELFEKFLDSTFEKFLAAERQIQVSKAEADAKAKANRR